MVSLIHRLLNLNPHELPRISLAWSLQIILRIGFVMGWTVTLAIFLEKEGIQKLPLLLLGNAFLVMTSSLIFSEILKRSRQEMVMLISVLLSSGLLLISSFLAQDHSLLFVMGVLIVQSVLLSQVNILANVFTEDLFSPLESQRAFPLIATAETIGGILGGLAITLLNPWIAPYKFIYLWGLALLSSIPLLLLSQRMIRKLPSLEIRKNDRQKTRFKVHPLKTIRTAAKRMKKSRLLQGIAALVFLQFMLFNLMEFQYTKAVEETVRQQSNQMSFAMNEYHPDGNLKVSLLEVNAIETEVQTATVEHQLAEKLAILQIIFSSGSLLVHLLLTSRILKHLGIVGTLFIHPLVSVVHCIALLIRFDFLTAGIARSSFEVTRGLFNTAYHGSYYVLSEGIRTQIKELMEGLIKPLGAFAAFGVLILIQSGFSSSDQVWVTSLLLVTVALAFLIPLISLQKNYVRFARRQLIKNPNLSERFNAVEILAQQGGLTESETLINTLQNPSENRRLKLKILETIKTHGKPHHFSLLLETLNTKNIGLKVEILETMNQIQGLELYLEKQPFLRHHAIQMLQNLNKKITSREAQKQAIQLLAKIEGGRMTGYLIDQLRHGSPLVQEAILRAFKNTQDPGIIPYAQPLLKSHFPEVQAAALIILCSFHKYESLIEPALKTLQQNEGKNHRIATIQVLSHLHRKEDLEFLIEQLNSPHFKVKEAAARALAQQGKPEGLESIIELLKHENPHVVHRTQKFTHKLEAKILKKLEQLLHLKISEHIQTLLNESAAKSLIEIHPKTLKKLQQAYAVVGEHEEVLKIENILGNLNPMNHGAPA